MKLKVKIIQDFFKLGEWVWIVLRSNCYLDPCFRKITMNEVIRVE